MDLVYGTAWKAEHTERLTRLALQAGFRAIDTANQLRHYHEAGAGAAITWALSAGVLAREALYVQTKFTFPAGQDHRLPYDPGAPTGRQVEQSFASSLSHLGVETLDAYLLHGPSTRDGLAAADLEAWAAMEALQAAGKTRLLGVSNVDLGQLRALCDRAKRPPAVVQNRCYARTGWDRAVREFCAAHGIVYQGFSLLTANRAELRKPAFSRLAERTGLTAAQLVFRFALQLGMQPLTGTTSPAHMREDLDCAGDTLSEEDLRGLETISEE